MCLFLEMLCVRKCRNLNKGNISPSQWIFFPYFSCTIAFLSKIIRGNTIPVYNLFYQLVVNMGKRYFRGPFLLRKIGTRYFRVPFPFEANIPPYQPQAREINFIFSHSIANISTLNIAMIVIRELRCRKLYQFPSHIMCIDFQYYIGACIVHQSIKKLTLPNIISKYASLTESTYNNLDWL